MMIQITIHYYDTNLIFDIIFVLIMSWTPSHCIINVGNIFLQSFVVIRNFLVVMTTLLCNCTYICRSHFLQKFTTLFHHHRSLKTLLGSAFRDPVHDRESDLVRNLMSIGTYILLGQFNNSNECVDAKSRQVLSQIFFLNKSWSVVAQRRDSFSLNTLYIKVTHHFDRIIIFFCDCEQSKSTILPNGVLFQEIWK